MALRIRDRATQEGISLFVSALARALYLPPMLVVLSRSVISRSRSGTAYVFPLEHSVLQGISTPQTQSAT